MENTKRGMSLDFNKPVRHHRGFQQTPSLVTPTLAISTPELDRMISNSDEFPLLTPNGISSIIPTSITGVLPSPFIPTSVSTGTPVIHSTSGNNLRDNSDKLSNYIDQKTNQKQRYVKSAKEMDREKIEKKRERNRLAAKKCRQKKLETIDDLKKTVSMWQNRHRILEEKFEVYKLESSRQIEHLTLENTKLRNRISE